MFKLMFQLPFYSLRFLNGTGFGYHYMGSKRIFSGADGPNVQVMDIQYAVYF